MPIPDIYAEATKAGIFDSIYWEQSFDNTVIKQPNGQEDDEPSLYSAQLSSPYFLKAALSSDPTKGGDFSFQYLPSTTPVEELCNGLCARSITFDNSPIAQSRPPSSRYPTSQLKRPATNSSRNIWSPPAPPRISPTKQVGIQGGKKPGKKVKFYRSSDYDPLYVAPASWDIFEYNSFGELSPGRTYTPQVLVRYLYSNPQNHVRETYTPKLGGLTLWVQRTPGDFCGNYGHPEAALCRFQNCDHNNNVIKAGEIRVAFDELTKKISNINPQRNAGYVHLSCLEKKTNFPILCKDLDVKAEARVFPLELTYGNPMTLQDGGSGSVLEHVQRFIDFCNRMGRPPKSYSAQGGRLIDEILQLEQPRMMKKIKTGVEGEDGDKEKAEDQYSKDISNVFINNNRLKKRKADKIYTPAAKRKNGEIEIMKVKKRARAENEKYRNEDSAEEEKEPDRSAPLRREGIKKARAMISPRARITTRKVPPTPAPALESTSDSDSSALTELDTETESSEEEEDDDDEYPPRRSKYAKYGHEKPRN